MAFKLYEKGITEFLKVFLFVKEFYFGMTQ